MSNYLLLVFTSETRLFSWFAYLLGSSHVKYACTLKMTCGKGQCNLDYYLALRSSGRVLGVAIDSREDGIKYKALYKNCTKKFENDAMFKVLAIPITCHR